MRKTPLDSENANTAVGSAALFRQFHAGLPLAGTPPNDLFTNPDALLLYLVSAIRNKPRVPPDVPLVEWQTFLYCLTSYGIIPLITWHLKSWPEDCRPPKEIMALLSKMLMSTGAWSLRHGRQIRIITTALEDAGITVLLLKGPALARTVYPDPALRYSSDIDLLVKPEDVLKCEPVFTQLGYSCPERTFHFAPHDQHHQVFLPPGNGSRVELHWVADANYRMFCPGWLTTAFDRKIRVTSEDLSFYTLHPVDHLTFLAFHHVFQHQALRLDWICDIALLKNRLTVPDDWDEIRATCAANHIRIPLELALTASILWGAYDIPEEYRDFSIWQKASAREQTLWKHAIHRQTHFHSAVYLKLQGLPSSFEKLRVCGRYIMPPRELLRPYRKSASCFDIPIAYVRQLFRFFHYKL